MIGVYHVFTDNDGIEVLHTGTLYSCRLYIEMNERRHLLQLMQVNEFEKAYRLVND